MENQRDKVVVILAGYKDRMDSFFESNPGMSSRIAHHLHFEDYELGERRGVRNEVSESLISRSFAGWTVEAVTRAELHEPHSDDAGTRRQAAARLTERARAGPRGMQREESLHIWDRRARSRTRALIMRVLGRGEPLTTEPPKG
ncbi:MAG: hypothetical protein ACLPUO_27460 [Streptosporangiaceae bacterium]|jgi:hypothetical protein